MAYEGVTARGNKVDAKLHAEFMEHVLEAQMNGLDAPDYDSWYEANKKPETLSLRQVPMKGLRYGGT